MPLYDLVCECGYTTETIVYKDLPVCPECGRGLKKQFPLYAYVKLKGEGGYPSRYKHVFNTTYRNHPKLNKETNPVYFV